MKQMTGENSALLRRMVALLHTGWTGTTRDLASQVFTTYRAADRPLWILREVGLARIVGWRSLKGKGAQLAAVWGFGEGLPDADRPSKSIPDGLRFNPDNSPLSDMLIQFLQSYGPCSAKEISEKFGMSRCQANYYCVTLRRARRIHIAGWRREGSYPPVMLVAAGAGRDAPQPPKRTPLECSQARRKTLTEKFGAETAKRIMTARSDGGVDKVIRDGVVVYQRGTARGMRA